MARTLLRDKARLLRAKGNSLNEITKYLKIVPKSTVRYWCRDILLSDTQQRRLFKKQKFGGIYAAERIRQRRLSLIRQLLDEGAREIKSISRRELLLIGAALYWAEGYRKGDGEFGFTNADPDMILVVLHWLQQMCGVDKKMIHLRVCINISHKQRIKSIQNFWSRTTGIPRDQFSKPTFINTENRKKYLNSANYFGTLRIKVRCSRNLRRKIVGWIEGIKRNIS